MESQFCEKIWYFPLRNVRFLYYTNIYSIICPLVTGGWKQENFKFLAPKVLAVIYKQYSCLQELSNILIWLEKWFFGKLVELRRGGCFQVVVATRGSTVFIIRVPVSGHMSSSSLTIPSPCFSVHIFIGEPPPIFWYCSWILGVLLLAIHAAILLRIIH